MIFVRQQRPLVAGHIAFMGGTGHDDGRTLLNQQGLQPQTDCQIKLFLGLVSAGGAADKGLLGGAARRRDRLLHTQAGHLMTGIDADDLAVQRQSRFRFGFGLRYRYRFGFRLLLHGIGRGLFRLLRRFCRLLLGCAAGTQTQQRQQHCGHFLHYFQPFAFSNFTIVSRFNCSVLVSMESE